MLAFFLTVHFGLTVRFSLKSSTGAIQVVVCNLVFQFIQETHVLVVHGGIGKAFVHEIADHMLETFITQEFKTFVFQCQTITGLRCIL